jgi:3-oxoacyl-[acyl-carrier protein] reductase
MFSLQDKTALVTGATGGIGESIARALHAQGAVVGISGRNIEKLTALAVSLGDRVHILPADLSDATASDALITNSIIAMGRIDILINNAGLTRDNLALRLKDEDWQAVLDVNLTAPFRLARSCLKSMMKNRWGRIINITSIVGVTGNPGQTNYAASKAGMIGWSKSLAAEIASRNVTVNCIAPGFIATSMTHVLNEEQKEKLNSTIPMGRMGTADEIAAAAAYLASNEAAYVTGQTLHVNGGMAMI